MYSVAELELGQKFCESGQVTVTVSCPWFDSASEFLYALLSQYCLHFCISIVFCHMEFVLLHIRLLNIVNK